MMRLLLLIATFIALTGCASDGYRYHDAGYYTARANRPVLIIDYGNACAFGYSPYGRSAYPCGSGFGYGYGYGSWYGASYWSHPYWSQTWYAPSANERSAAGLRARGWAQNANASEASIPRYDDLAPARRRDTGSVGGGFGYSRSYGPSADMGAPSMRSRSAGIGSGMSQRGMSSPRQDNSARYAAPRSNPVSARTTRDARQEE